MSSSRPVGTLYIGREGILLPSTRSKARDVCNYETGASSWFYGQTVKRRASEREVDWFEVFCGSRNQHCM